MTHFSKTSIDGCYRFQVSPRFQDERGAFIKPLHLHFLREHGQNFECRESFVSHSKVGVVRGLHFQIAPHAHQKIVTCLDGEIFDVVLDLRPRSSTYLQAETFRLRGQSAESVLVPVGCAHGFQVVSETGAWVAYYTTKEHHAESDRGIFWQSAPVEWPHTHPVISARDAGFPHLQELKSGGVAFF